MLYFENRISKDLDFFCKYLCGDSCTFLSSSLEQLDLGGKKGDLFISLCDEKFGINYNVNL